MFKNHPQTGIGVKEGYIKHVIRGLVLVTQYYARPRIRQRLEDLELVIDETELLWGVSIVC
jgi:hypothetical protein